MLDVYTVLIREITRNYRETTPASATIEMDDVSAELAAEVRGLPGVTMTERRRAVDARVRDGADWRPLRLFVVENFEHLQLNTFTPQNGAWPPPTGTLLLERTAVRLMGSKTGDTIMVRSPNGEPLNVNISGMVHDTGLAPSEQERTIYAYATEETLRALGESGGFDELRVLLAPEFMERTAIAMKCHEVVTWLQARGHVVHGIRIPPPRRHPHQGPMEAVLRSFIGFGAMALLLSSVLMATTMNALLAKQVRQIAIMKAIGASRRQLAMIYGALALAIGVVAVILAVPVGLAVARPFATQISNLINFSIATHAVPHDVLLFQVTVGILLPVLAAAWPICRAVNLPVRVGLADHGARTTSANERAGSVSARWFVAMPRWTLAWRNSLRRRLRFVLTLTLLGTSGAILMSAFNLRTAWLEMIGRVYTERSYDVSFKLRSPEIIGTLVDALREVPVIKRTEAWQSSPVAFHVPGEVPVVSVYPDGGHGAFTLYGVPPDTKMIAFPLTSGRWLKTGDTKSVVLNHAAQAARRDLSVGDRVSLVVDGNADEWTVVGFVEEVGSAAAAYVPLAEFPGRGTGPAKSNLLRISTTSRSPAAKAETIRQVEHALEKHGVRVTLSLPLAELQTAMGQHIAVLLSTLLAAALVMGIVAALGLSAILSMSVIERTREFGVLRAVGATPSDVSWLVIAEALAMGLIGLLFAVPLSVGISLLLGRIVGMTAFQIPLPLNFSVGGLIVCLVGLFVLIAAAAGIPARSAARLTVRTALDYS
jgi:putative ABC transport system permease protein